MTTIHANVPDYLAKLAEQTAKKENVSMDQIVALALSAQVAVLNLMEDIEVRAQRGKGGNLEEFLANRPDRPPLPGDEL